MDRACSKLLKRCHCCIRFVRANKIINPKWKESFGTLWWQDHAIFSAFILLIRKKTGIASVHHPFTLQLITEAATNDTRTRMDTHRDRSRRTITSCSHCGLVCSNGLVGFCQSCDRRDGDASSRRRHVAQPHKRRDQAPPFSEERSSHITTSSQIKPLEYSRQTTRNELQGKRNLGSSRKQKGRTWKRNAGLQPLTGANNVQLDLYKGKAMQDEQEIYRDRDSTKIKQKYRSTKSIARKEQEQKREGVQGERPEPSEYTLR